MRFGLSVPRIDGETTSSPCLLLAAILLVLVRRAAGARTVGSSRCCREDVDFTEGEVGLLALPGVRRPALLGRDRFRLERGLRDGSRSRLVRGVPIPSSFLSASAAASAPERRPS